MDFDLQEAEFARAVLGCGERRFVITDASKFLRRGVVRVAGFDRVDELVTDAPPPAALAEAMDAAGTLLRLAPTGDNGQ